MRFLLCLILAGCSLSHGPFIAPVKTIDINIINQEVCSELSEVKDYLLSQGVLLRENIAAKKTLVCLSSPSWIFRVLSPLYVAGLSDGKVVWSLNDKKIILHELGHLLWGFPHSARGLMFPISDAGVFATGFTDKQLIQMRQP